MKEAKVIQSRLSRKGVTLSLAQIREHIAEKYDQAEMAEDVISKIVEDLAGSSEMVPIEKSELSHTQKQTLIQQVASTLDINLSLEQITGISKKMNWALSDRASLKERVRDAIIAWVDYQIEQDKRQTDEMMREVEGHLVTRLQESNQHFNNRARDFSERVSDAVEKFRTTETEILDLFKVPN
ncbi:hypothetical protein [Anabaena sp. CCY 9910]|uniref:hypothetical protein n=1 Tax=Anabaena sp. CCY 9910 TaxID=3103870 RepID=UPI0039E0F630